MEDVFFSIEEAASILDCAPSTVYRMLDNGWLSRPGGGSGTKKDRRGRVTKKSLFQLLVIDRLNTLPRRTLNELKKRRKHFGRIFSQNAEANRMSKVEGTDGNSGTDGTNERVERPEPSEIEPGPIKAPKQCLHHEFVEVHQFSFGWRAWQLAPGDPAMQDDLVQEMSLAVLEYDKPASFEFLFGRATSRAKDYLKYEARRGMLSLSEVRQVSDTFALKIASLNDFFGTLMQRGVPLAWIEEVIGERLDAA